MGLSEASISSPATRVSLNQVVDFYRYAAEHSCDPHFGYHIGLRFHVSAYGMYGFAILSSINYRQTMQFAVKYHQLAMPLTAIEFTENNGYGIYLFNPVSHPRIDARLYKFIVEMKFGIFLSLHRDIMGPSFPRESFKLPIPQLLMHQNIRPSSGLRSNLGNPQTGCCSIRVGWTACRGLAMKLRIRPW